MSVIISSAICTTGNDDAKVRFFFGIAKMFIGEVLVDKHEWQQMGL